MTKMSAARHLKELQWRLMLVAFFFIVGAVLAYNYRDTIMPFLLKPLNGQKLVYLTPGGGFTFVFLVTVYAGIALAFPLLLQQVYAFLRPALPPKARKKSSVIIISSLLLLVSGILFGYFIAVPNALTFLYGFADQYVQSTLTADSYLNFIVSYTIGIGIVFQLPLLLLLLHVIKPLTPGGLMKSQKWVILVAFIIAAIITPTPDPVNQTIMAGPIILVYQIGVIAVLVAIFRERRQVKREQRAVEKVAPIEAEVVTPAVPEPVPASVPQLPVEPVPQPVKKSIAVVFAQEEAPVVRPPKKIPVLMSEPESTQVFVSIPQLPHPPVRRLYIDGIIGPGPRIA